MSRRTVGIAVLFCAAAVAQNRVITTAAGTDVVPVVDGTAALQGAIEPWGVAMDTAGNLYICDGSRDVVVRVDPSGRYFRFAGNGIPVYAGDGGPAQNASLNDPERVVVDGNGNVYVSESGNHRVRRIAPDGTITTFAGTGQPGFSGDGGSAAAAALNYPVGLALDAAGNLYVADFNNKRVRRITPQGTITTVAGNGQAGFSGDGQAATQAAINGYGVGISPSGELFIADTFNNRVRRVNAQGVISTIAGTGTQGFSGDGGPAASATLNWPYAIAFDSQSNAYVLDYLNNRVRRISAAGIISTYAGNGQLGSGGAGLPAAQAPVNFAFAVATSPAGALLIADTSGKRVKQVGADGTMTFLAGTGRPLLSPDGALATSSLLNGPQGVRLDRSGELLIADTFSHQVKRLRNDGTLVTIAGTGEVGATGDGGPAVQATLQNVSDVAADQSGNIWIADTGNNRIRRVSPQGVITTAAGTGSFDCSVAANVPVQPKGLAFHPVTGELYFSDACHYIRRLDSQGRVVIVAGTGQAGFADGTAAAARFNNPARIAFDAAGNLFIADESNHRLRRLDTGGQVSTVAGTGTPGNGGDGGPALSAQLRIPRGVLVLANNDILVSEFGNHRVRIISGGRIDAFAGNGVEAWAGDGGPAALASVRRPEGMVADAGGNIFLADWGNNRVRRILAAPPAVQTSFVGGAEISLSLRAGEVSDFRSIETSAAVLGLGYQVVVSQPWLEADPRAGATPARVRLRANASTLSPGTYRGSVTVRTPLGVPAERAIPVTLEVTAGGPPRLAAVTQSLTFSFVAGEEPKNDFLLAGNSGTGALNLTTTVQSGPFLTVADASASATQAQPARFAVAANPAGLGAGTYTGAIRVGSGSTNETLTVPVTMTITPAQAKLALSRTGLTFRAVAGAGAPLSQEVTVANTGRGSMSWTASASTLGGGSGWLRLSANGGAVPDPASFSSLDVSVNPAGLGAGEYYGRVDVRTAGNTPQTVSVLLVVLPATATLPPEVQPEGMIFTAERGTNPAAQVVRIATRGRSVLNFNSSRSTLSGGNWFAHLPVGGTVEPNAPVRIAVQPLLAGLGEGTYQGALTVQFSDGTSQTVNILSIVTNNAAADKSDAVFAPCTPNALNLMLTTPQLVAAASNQTTDLGVRALDNCGRPLTNESKNFSINIGFAPTAEPAQPMAHVKDGLWNKSFQARAVRNGTVTASITAFLALPNLRFVASQVDVQINVTEGGATPAIAPGQVLNAASFLGSTPSAPGTLITLFGANLADSDRSALGLSPWPTEFNDVQVRLGDRPLPLLFVGRNQINAQIPFDLPLNSQHQILVRKGATLSVPDALSVGPVQPAVFSVAQNGRGQGAITNGVTNVVADTANPVRAGDVISVYCTGLGPVSPPVPEGTQAPLTVLSRTTNPMRVTIGGQEAVIQFNGLAPGLVGVYQVNAFVPAGVTGNEVPVVLEIAGQQSPPVTIAVR